MLSDRISQAAPVVQSNGATGFKHPQWMCTRRSRATGWRHCPVPSNSIAVRDCSLPRGVSRYAKLPLHDINPRSNNSKVCNSLEYKPSHHPDPTPRLLFEGKGVIGAFICAVGQFRLVKEPRTKLLVAAPETHKTQKYTPHTITTIEYMN